MYFETTMHGSRPVESALHAARLIKGEIPKSETYNPDEYVHDYDALIWTAENGRKLAVVADNHCNNPWLEVAVIDLDRSIQMESITAGWCKSADELAEYFVKCETGEPFGGEVTLPLDGKNADAKADFECGCCGTFFESTYEKQKRFDQDNGFGICPKCERMYR
jgi:hypothetical protein